MVCKSLYIFVFNHAYVNIFGGVSIDLSQFDYRKDAHDNTLDGIQSLPHAGVSISIAYG